MVTPKEVFVDATHVKACANNKKVTTEIVKQEALFYEEQLEKEINFDRSKHGKKPLKDKKYYDDDNNNNNNSGSSSGGNFKEEKCSTSDP